MTASITWQLTREHGKIGTGNWAAFPKERLDDLFAAAEGWKTAVRGIERPWLCWCVDDEWCSLQQQLVLAAGWTPVVGTDGNVRTPRVMPGSVFVNFNERLQLPVMWMHFPLDFVHHFCERLAFWHSDVLPPVSVMRRIANQFDAIADGELIAILGAGGPLQWINRWRAGKQAFHKRWKEFTGCTTAGASRSMWEHGAGWWRYPQQHPNPNSTIIEQDPFREHGVGVWMWHRHCGGRVRELCVDIERWHYSNRHPDYVRLRDANKKIADSKRDELNRSFDLDTIRRGLGLEDHV